MYVLTSIQNFSPFYKTLSPVGAAAQKGLRVGKGVRGGNTEEGMEEEKGADGEGGEELDKG